MIKYLKKLWKKIFGKTSKTLPENVGAEIVEPTPKPQHCGAHSRFIKGCPTCREVVK
tara:strand:- start:51 stop:221 length:171 start_codon:yes stop_codon:yes gene_type:complete